MNEEFTEILSQIKENSCRANFDMECLGKHCGNEECAHHCAHSYHTAKQVCSNPKAVLEEIVATRIAPHFCCKRANPAEKEMDDVCQFGYRPNLELKDKKDCPNVNISVGPTQSVAREVANLTGHSLLDMYARIEQIKKKGDFDEMKRYQRELEAIRDNARKKKW